MKTRPQKAHYAGTGFPPCFSPAGYPLRDENQGRRVFYSPGSGRLLDSVTAVYGKQLAKEMLPVRSAEQGLSLTGLTGKPSLSRSSRSHITVIINGRYVRCPVVTAATEEAYRSLLPQGRRPVTVLALKVDPELLDVNVHPAKLEVRLLEEEKIAGLVTRTLMEAIRVKEIIPATKVTRPVLESSEHKESRFQLTIHQQQDQQVPPPGLETVICEQVTAKYETAGPGLSLERQTREQQNLARKRQNQPKKRPELCSGKRTACFKRPGPPDSRLYSGCRKRRTLYCRPTCCPRKRSFMKAT